MKLSVIDSEEAELIVPRISEYANTQNRVNAADFFSNHPFHIRIEEFSRRLWAPAQQGAQRETKWFYERGRGQYTDAQAGLTPAEKRRFKAENSKPQMFTKTDLAKFENIWEDHPRWVNLGAQKNFARYAARIGKVWEKSAEHFNELYFRRAIARAILFRTTEKLVSAQAWYNGGYRANIVAYALASLAEICKRKAKSIDLLKICDAQVLSEEMKSTIAISAKLVNDDITRPPEGISNISEWAKKEACWTRLRAKMEVLEKELPTSFYENLISEEEGRERKRTARSTQKIDDGIDVQKRVFETPPEKWSQILQQGTRRKFLTPKEIGILKIAEQMPRKLPTEKQSAVLVQVLEKAAGEDLT